MAGFAARADNAQRRFPPLGLPIAVLYKYFDDQGNYLAAMITYYAFVAIFPLLLLGTSILGFVLQGDPELRQQALDSTLRNFPIIGDQLGRPEGLQGSVSGVVLGGLVALYGALGLGQAVQNAMHVVWAVPRNSRPNPVLQRLTSLGLIIVVGLAILAVTALSVLGRDTDVLGDGLSGPVRWLITVANVLLIALVLTLLLRLAAAKRLPFRQAAPGGLFIAVLWQVLQLISTQYISSVAAGASSMGKTFGLVLGLIGVIFVAANIAVMGMDLNVVLARRLWPRALLTPFTDAVDLTDADRRAYTSYARAQRHKGFEEVAVTFAEREPETEPETEAETEAETETETETEPRPGPGDPVDRPRP